MGRLVEEQVEVFALLVGFDDFAADEGGGEGGAGGVGFDEDDGVVGGVEGGDGAVEKVVAQEVYDARDFADFWHGGLWPILYALSCGMGAERAL